MTFADRIKQMNRTYRQPVHETPTLPEDYVQRLINFGGVILKFEVLEYADIVDDSLDVGREDVDTLTDIADWLADVVVYARSEAAKYGIPLEEVLDIVMDSNDSKLGADGRPILDSTGQKFLKGPNYQPPEPRIRELLTQRMGLAQAERV